MTSSCAHARAVHPANFLIEHEMISLLRPGIEDDSLSRTVVVFLNDRFCHPPILVLKTRMTEAKDMMNLLLGQFDSPIDDTARDFVFECLKPLHAVDYPQGSSKIQITDSTSVTVFLDRPEAVMLSLVDRILKNAVAAYQGKYSKESKHISSAKLYFEVWRSLAAIRSQGYAHGVYALQLSDEQIELYVGRWDAVLLEQCDTFICELYRKHWWIFNEALAEGPKAFAPRLSQAIERAA